MPRYLHEQLVHLQSLKYGVSKAALAQAKISRDAIVVLAIHPQPTNISAEMSRATSMGVRTLI
ncbi:hypothetical protein [Pantanalinema rosaneae]|uniref:hypothetical protein n=1 Tax=Pantanalinema rosaneae TaxID=1620701 RepID=UPI003D6DDCFD